MATETSASSLLWVGWIVSGLVIAFLIFNGATKVLKVTPVMEACARLGLGPNTALRIGLVLLASTAVYVIPQTAVLGAILLTAFLGGAVATHVRAGSSVFETVFPIGFCGLAWLGLVLREPRLLGMILLRQ
jgi:hypothetical protein